MFDKLFNYFKPDPIYGGVPRSSEWRKVRNLHIKQNPFCAVCGCTKDLQVHHILPYHLYPEKELDLDNLITLGIKCSSGNHHYLFGHFENWHNYNEDVSLHANLYFEKINENLDNKRHPHFSL